MPVKRWPVFPITAAVCTLLGWLITPQTPWTAPSTDAPSATVPIADTAGKPPIAGKLPAAGKPPAAGKLPAARIAYTLATTSEDDLLAYSIAHQLLHPESPLLLDEPGVREANRQFLERFAPERVVNVKLSRFAGLIGFDRAERVVVCPSEPRGALLQAACFAGVVRAPLVVLSGQAEDTDDAELLKAELSRLGVDTVYAVGQAAQSIAARALAHAKADTQDNTQGRVVHLADAKAVAQAHRRELAQHGPIRALVLTNPSDIDARLGRHSTLAPWLALTHGAVLLLTDPTGDDASSVVADALTEPDLAGVDALLIVGTQRAIPLERRANPAPGKDESVAVEVGTPHGEHQPVTLAVGRLIHSERAVLPLIVARGRLLNDQPVIPRRAMIAANSGGSLPMMETIARVSAQELSNAGYTVNARFDDAVSARELRKLLPKQDLFIWEGHYRTLVDSYRIGQWTEPLPPQLIVLQSCLALNPTDCGPLLQRGAVAVVGSPSRVYAGSGSAFSLAFVDAFIHNRQSLGSALRQAKNFLLCYSQLKRQRLAGEAKLNGSSLRAMWAFALWGDPTLHWPAPPPPAEALPAISCAVEGDTIRWRVPAQMLAGVGVGDYYARTWPNGRLAGLVLADDGDRRLAPMLFAEVSLPQVPAGCTPTLTTRLPRSRWQFLWDGRRRVGYLLVLPGERPLTELAFRVVIRRIDL